MAKKVELKERGTNETIYPITQAGCVIDSNGKDLEERLKSNEIAILTISDIVPDFSGDFELLTEEDKVAIAQKYKELLQTHSWNQIYIAMFPIDFDLNWIFYPNSKYAYMYEYIQNSGLGTDAVDSDKSSPTLQILHIVADPDNNDVGIDYGHTYIADNDSLKKHIDDETPTKHIPSGGAAGQILEWKSSGEAQWADLPTVPLPMLKDVLAYGVEWDQNVGDPHLTRIGNPTLHKTLPIQSQLKGCIAQGNKIMYWLHPDDWKMKSTAKQLTGETLNDSKGLVSCEDVEGKPYSSLYTYELGTDMMALDFKVGDHVLIKGFSGISAVGEVLSIEDGANSEISKVIKIRFDFDTLYEKEKMAGDAGEHGTKLTLKGEPSRLDGYDGTVRVYCPQFYIKSETVDDTSRVWISTVKIDDDWTQQPEILIDAYRSTVLNAVPENMGYLSTLPVNSAISVVNTAAYCRGGNNSSKNDKYLEGVQASEGVEAIPMDIFRTELGKSKHLTMSEGREYARKTFSEVLSYDQYKNIFYWLYVIEYANFNCQEMFNSSLTDDGFRQGGMSKGITEYKYSEQYNNTNVTKTPHGYGNSLGNNSGIIPLTIPEYISPADDFSAEFDAVIKSSNGTSQAGQVNITNITSNTESTFYVPALKSGIKVKYTITGLTDSEETIIFETNSGSSVTKLGELSEDGEIIIQWPNTVDNREFRFSKIKSGVNIIVRFTHLETGTIVIPSCTMQMPRWRGFDNPFGDSGIMLEGILISQNNSTKLLDIYTCQDYSKYAEVIGDGYNKVGEFQKINGFIKLFDLGNSANIFPKIGGGSATQYKCDYSQVVTINNIIPLLEVGVSSQNESGLCNLIVSPLRTLGGNIRTVSHDVFFDN